MTTASLMTNYAPLPVTFTHGEGAYLFDENGNRYLDAVSGIAVCSLGHAHPAIAEAICDQAGKLMHTSNLYNIEQQQKLADKLTALSGMDKAFFCNSGAEANEAAIKLARLHGHKHDIDNPCIIVTDNSFHGRTLATLTATGNRKVHAGFEPLVQGFVRAPYNDLEAIRTIAETNKNVVAVLVEPAQGEGGVNIPGNDYLEGLRELCNKNSWLLMLDEIQTGMCRTGEWFAFQNTKIQPDVITLAKALGNGMPIGACLARGEAADLFKPGNHGTTFGGNPLACRVANTVIDIMQAEKIADRTKVLSSKMLDGFSNELGQADGVSDIRGTGLLLGIELDRPCGELVKQALEKHILINVTADKVVRLLPPLNITDEQADEIIAIVSELVRSFLNQE